MASSIFRVSRTETEGQQSGPATLNKAQEPVKMRVYEDESDVDLSEIGDKEIFAVEEENDLANVYVTDLVQEGNMNPITSNAVAEYIKNQNVLSDYETASSSFTAEYDGFFEGREVGGQTATVLTINGNPLGTYGNYPSYISIAIKKGDVISSNLTGCKVAYYKLRDYTGR
jgi:hypothetical protein